MDRGLGQSKVEVAGVTGEVEVVAKQADLSFTVRLTRVLVMAVPNLLPTGKHL